MRPFLEKNNFSKMVFFQNWNFFQFLLWFFRTVHFFEGNVHFVQGFSFWLFNVSGDKPGKKALLLVVFVEENKSQF